MEVEEAAAAAATRRVHLRAARAALRVLCAGSHAECAARVAHFFLAAARSPLCCARSQTRRPRRPRCSRSRRPRCSRRSCYSRSRIARAARATRAARADWRGGNHRRGQRCSRSRRAQLGTVSHKHNYCVNTT